jgi:hypothetical protein
MIRPLQLRLRSAHLSQRLSNMSHSHDGAAQPCPAPIVLKNQLQTMEHDLQSLREAQVRQLEAKIKDLESQLLEYSRRYSKLKVRCRRRSSSHVVIHLQVDFKYNLDLYHHVESQAAAAIDENTRLLAALSQARV